MTAIIGFILALYSLVASAVTTGVSYSAPATTQATLAEIYYGYSAQTSSSVYLSGQNVSFFLKNNTHTPLLPPVTWGIVDPSGKVIYASVASHAPPYLFSGSWNQKNRDGEQAPPGVYTLIFPETPNKASVVFSILPGKNNPLDRNDNQQTGLPLSSI